jgi:hypothetical protein
VGLLGLGSAGFGKWTPQLSLCHRWELGQGGRPSRCRRLQAITKVKRETEAALKVFEKR